MTRQAEVPTSELPRKRKKYKFAQFKEYGNCYEAQEWKPSLLSGEVTIEVGAGNAFFSVEMAAKYTDRQFVAIDVKADRLQQGARLALERDLDNVYFLRAPATELSSLFAPHSIAEIWLTFPDPQPKKRNIKHRLTNQSFLGAYQRLLRPDGQLRLKTDSHDLFDWSLEELVGSGWSIAVLAYDLHSTEGHEDAKILTTYERRYMAEGLSTKYLEAISK